MIGTKGLYTLSRKPDERKQSKVIEKAIEKPRFLMSLKDFQVRQHSNT